MGYNMDKHLVSLYTAVLKYGYKIAECREGSWLGEKYADMYRIVVEPLGPAKGLTFILRARREDGL